MTSRAASSFVFLLISLTLLGHACEVPIGAVLAAHAHDDAHDAAHHHPEDSEAVCDAVLAVHRTTETSIQPDAVLQAPMPPLIRLGVPRTVSVVRESQAVRRRPPLFLLHSALLI